MSRRVAGELREWSKDPPLDIFLCPLSEDSLETVVGLIIGPPDTPYSNGFFFFSFSYGEDYPLKPMICVCINTNEGRTRWNPNIYSNGKVCLSILGTWNGNIDEQWRPLHTTRSILTTIRSILGENPFCNEPGFEEVVERYKELPLQYNTKILHESLRYSVCQTLHAVMSGRPLCFVCPQPLLDVMKTMFLYYYDVYKCQIERLEGEMEKASVSDGSEFRKMPFEPPSNEICGTFYVEGIREELKFVKKLLDEEEERWVKEGEECTLKRTPDAQELEIESTQIAIDGIFASPREGNFFVWDVTFFGDIGRYEGGIFRAEMIVPPFVRSYSLLPRVRFTTSMFHPNISSTDQRPFIPLHVPANKTWNISSVLLSIKQILKDDPNPDPIGDINPEAAKVWRGQDKTYNRHVRRCVSRSQEE